MEAAYKPAFIAPSSPIATLPTGMPFGICTIDNKLSNPFNLRLSTGTPITGIVVNDAIIPGKCAEPTYLFLSKNVKDGLRRVAKYNHTTLSHLLEEGAKRVINEETLKMREDMHNLNQIKSIVSH